MRKHCKLSCFSDTANGAITFLFTLFGTGCHLGYSPFSEGMSECRNRLTFNDNFAANGAVTTLGKSRFGAGRCNGGINYKLMSACVRIVGYIAVTAVTGIGCISSFGAGRFRNNRRIAVAGSRNNLCFRAVTANTGSLLKSVLGAGCILDDYPIAEFTAESFDKVALICVSAFFTSIGRVTALMTGRSGYNAPVIAVICRRDNLGVAVAAMTGVCHDTVFGAGCRSCYNTDVFVSECRYIRLLGNFRMVTTFTCERCISLFGTGRLGYNRGKVMTQGVNLIDRVAVSANRTFANRITARCAGRLNNLVCKLVAVCRNDRVLQLQLMSAN